MDTSLNFVLWLLVVSALLYGADVIYALPSLETGGGTSSRGDPSHRVTQASGRQDVPVETSWVAGTGDVQPNPEHVRPNPGNVQPNHANTPQPRDENTQPDHQELIQPSLENLQSNRKESAHGCEEQVCRPHITIQTSTPISLSHQGGDCNCSGISPAEVVESRQQTDKATASLVRQLQEMVETCRAGGPGTGEGRQSTNDDRTRQLYEALLDLTTVLKQFQTPGIPVPGSLISLPKDCSEVLSRGATTSGVYTIQTLDSGRPFQVYCDMETEGGGWTVLQKRQDGSVSFFRGYASYRRGFGSLAGEFWLGNDLIHRLTAQDEYHLRVDLTDFDDETTFADYRVFRVADVNDDYRLTVGSYQGTAGDALTTHSGQPFSTKDRDNDNWTSKNCAREYHGAWWYNSCYYASLNGEYLRGMSESYGTGIVWYQWHGYYYSLKETQIKIRPAD